jgi:hypothetical protein
MYIATGMDPLIPSIIRPGLYSREAQITLAALFVALVIPSAFTALFRQIERAFGRLARRRSLAVLMVALLSLAVRAALLPWLPIPVPGIHDEFSYLLQADTFAHGRLANPSPALWTHFETFHVLFHPTYVSKYPPMQGLILAAGQVLLGHPWFGVWLSTAAMCGAICWMLQGWLPPGWALLGGFLAVVRLGTFSYWVNSYWGGSAAAIGGALVLGALPRLIRRLRAKDSIWMALGLAILANSRPYEGLLLGMGVITVLFLAMARRSILSWRLVVSRVVLPLAVCMALTIAAMGYYNSRTTGRALVMPYKAYLAQYWAAPPFLWQDLNSHPPAYRYKVMEVTAVSEEIVPYMRSHTLPGFLETCISKILIVDSFFLGPVLTLPLIMFPWILRDRRMRPLLWISVVMLVGFMGETWFFPHYAAPATGLIYIVLLQCMRHLRVWTLRHRESGLMMVRLIPVVCLIMLGLRMNTNFSSKWTWFGAWPGNIPRAQIMKRLQEMPGRQLVFVRYSPLHRVDEEWVYNNADIEGSKAIWARDEDVQLNQELLRRYSDRTAWLLEPDEFPSKLLPYGPATELARANNSKK